MPARSRTTLVPLAASAQRGRLAYVGECCRNQLAIIHVSGLYSQRHYDFLDRNSSSSSSSKQRPGHVNSMKEADAAIAAYHNIVADTDKRAEAIARQGGIATLPLSPQVRFNMCGAPWKDADAAWFEQHPKRSHRARLVMPGEADKEAAEAPEGCELLLLIRQVEPGTRLKAGFYMRASMPMPDDEMLAHVLFEVASGHEPVPADSDAMQALIQEIQTTRAITVRAKRRAAPCRKTKARTIRSCSSKPQRREHQHHRA